jgi:epoxyqueuosine reductase QueG
MKLSEQIKDYALDLGYHAVGIAPANPFIQYAEALE